MEKILQELEELRKIVDGKATKSRENRDGLNQKMRGFIGTRNTYNSQVRELISEVQRQKVIRDEANTAVRTAKATRAEKNQLVKDAKQAIRELSPRSEEVEQRDNGRRGRRTKEDTPDSLRRKIEKLQADFEMGRFTGKNEKKFEKQIHEMRRKLRKMSESEESNVELKKARDDLNAAVEAQEIAHQEVTRVADSAQDAHDLMLKLSEEVDRLREQGDSSQSQVRKAKREPDQAHQSYIVSLRCLHSILDINRAHENRANGDDSEQGSDVPARVEVQDLMSKLMSGETLSTDELMALQRGG